MLQSRSAQREMVETVISIARVAYAQFPPILNGYGGTVIRKNEKTDCVSRERRLKKEQKKKTLLWCCLCFVAISGFVQCKQHSVQYKETFGCLPPVGGRGLPAGLKIQAKAQVQSPCTAVYW